MCGVVGVFGHDHAAAVARTALDALQHRGELSAGIATRVEGGHRRLVGLGSVRDVFRDVDLAKWPGRCAVGHVRYATAGGDGEENAQPLPMTIAGIGELSIAHNGNLVNTDEIRKKLLAEGVKASDSDTKLILHLMGYATGSVEDRLVAALRQVRGAYSLAVLFGDALIAVRDPHGFRPLVYGKLGSAWVVASETCALAAVGVEHWEFMLPGEMVVWRRDGLTNSFPFGYAPQKHCVFEDIYFAWPNSEFPHGNVAEMRIEHGRALARAVPAEADVVVPVLRSGYFAAKGFAEVCGLPDMEALLRAPRAGRTFILAGQDERVEAVRRKHQVIRSLVAGKRVVLVDDSIVRATTMKRLVQLFFEADVSEVHVRIASPPVTGPCHYGVDTPRRSELIAHKKSVEEICEFIDATSLGYLPLPDLHEAGRRVARGAKCGFCDACFSGDYPVPLG